MPDFKQRSQQPELIDADVRPETFRKNLKELNFLNRFLGGYNTSLCGIAHLIQNRNQSYHFVDLGCGGGGILRQTARWARKNNIRMQFTGVDINPDAITFLSQYCRDYPEITGVVSDYASYLAHPGHAIDIIHASLFCHHLSDAAIRDLLSYCKHNIKIGFVFSDLFREKIPYYGAKILSHVAMGTELSKKDGPLSVLRSFTIPEMIGLLKSVSLDQYIIKRKFVFRILIIGYANHRN